MSETKLLVVCTNKNGVVERPLIECLESYHIEVHAYHVNESEMEDWFDQVDAYLIVEGGSELDIHAETITHLKESCYKNSKKVMLYGLPEMLDGLKRIFTGSMIAASYERPMQMADLMTGIKTAIAAQNEVKEKKKVLVVDDSGMMLRTIMGWLGGKYAVALANSAMTAINAIEKSRPDLILLDYEMPVVSGAQFMEMLLEDPTKADIPIIFLTSRSDADTVKEVLALKPAGYILKSTPETKVIEQVDDFFRKNA